MDIINIPFNSHVGIARSKREGFLLELRKEKLHENHLGTVHASALFTLAEATSGEFLIRERGDREDIGGVVRRASCKYSRRASGDLNSRVTTAVEEVDAAIRQVDMKGRALIAIRVDLLNEDDQVVAGFEFTWMISSLEL